MKRLFPGDAKTVIVQTPDDLEFSIRDYPLARIVEVRRRRFRPVEFIARQWQRLMSWTPTAHQMRSIGTFLELSDTAIDSVCKIATVAIAIYFAAEICTGLLRHGVFAQILGGM